MKQLKKLMALAGWLVMTGLAAAVDTPTPSPTSTPSPTPTPTTSPTPVDGYPVMRDATTHNRTVSTGTVSDIAVWAAGDYYVNETGDTMTGSLLITSGNPALNATTTSPQAGYFASSSTNPGAPTSTVGVLGSESTGPANIADNFDSNNGIAFIARSQTGPSGFFRAGSRYATPAFDASDNTSATLVVQLGDSQPSSTMMVQVQNETQHLVFGADGDGNTFTTGTATVAGSSIVYGYSFEVKSPVVAPGSTQTIDAAGDSIAPDASGRAVLDSDSAAGWTLTSTPTIADPVIGSSGNGQILVVCASNGDTDKTFIQDQATLANSNVRLKYPKRLITDGAYLTLMWDGVVWNETAYTGPDVETISIPDNGGGTPADYTLVASARVIKLSTADADGANVTMSETGIKEGQQLTVVNIGANTLNFADTGGVSELAGAFAAGIHDSITMTYNGTTWEEEGRSDN